MAIQKLQVETLEISREEAVKLHELDSNVTIPSDAFNIFENYYVRKNKDLLTLVKYFFCRYQQNQQCPNLSCFAIKLELSNDVMEVVACRNKKNDAKNLAAYKMLNKINTIIPNFFKAQNLIGLPNFRGSCFMIAVLLQFFWSNLVITSLMNFKFANESFKGKLLSALIKLLETYVKAARKESLEVLNCPTNLHLKYENRPIIEKVKDNPRRPGFKAEVELDANMMAILKILADDKNLTIYETPGGYCHSFYDDLLNSIDKECIAQKVHNPLDPIFSIIFELKSGIGQKKVNYIELETKYTGIDSLQELIDTSTVIKDFHRFVNLPKILTFFVSDPLDEFLSEEGNLKIDRQLSVDSSNFDLVGLIIGFGVYKNAEGEIIYRHVRWKPGFNFVGNHAFSLIKTKDGFLEINNHNIFEPTREYNVLRPQMMLFYEQVIA